MKKSKLFKLISISLTSIVIVGGVYFKTVADSCSSISDCQNQINNANNQVSNLKTQATSYQNAISILQAQINQYQVIINANQQQANQLNSQILQTEADIATSKKTLAEDIKSMYINGKTSALEQLAGSGNISTFVDAQTYRLAVNSSVQSLLDKLNQNEKDLKQKQTQVASIIADNESKKSSVLSSQSQQKSLLSYSSSQISSFNTQTSQNQATLNRLIAEQRAANNSTGSSSGGGYYFIHFPGSIQRDPCPNGQCSSSSYSYADWPFSMSTAPGCVDNDGPDQWGYCTRQCVSYAAWAVAYSGRQAPIGWGNAKDWVWHARNAGIPFDTLPEVGDVAVSTKGTWGHVMYVEAVNGNQILVSQYNQQLTGQFSTQWRTWQ